MIKLTPDLVLSFGKYQGYSISQLQRTDKGYYLWLMDNWSQNKEIGRHQRSAPKKETKLKKTKETSDEEKPLIHKCTLCLILRASINEDKICKTCLSPYNCNSIPTSVKLNCIEREKKGLLNF
jgi:hypothetical protein